MRLHIGCRQATPECDLYLQISRFLSHIVHNAMLPSARSFVGAQL